MSICSVALVGIDGWKDYTLPALASLAQHEPAIPLFAIDNGSQAAYPPDDWYSVIRIQRVNYAAAINVALGVMDTEWKIILNNDIRCYAPFADKVTMLDRNTVWGKQLIEQGDWRWHGGWCYCFHRDLVEDVGLFDEQFELCGFEDADYCFRALEKGYSIELSDLPFSHLWGRTRWALPGYPTVRIKNLEKLNAKYGTEFKPELWNVTE